MKISYNSLVLATLMYTMLCVSCDKEPQALVYHGFTCEGQSQEYFADKGTSATIAAEVISENGVKNIYVKIGGWKDGEAEFSEVINVLGSPKTYALRYQVNIPQQANAVENNVEFTIEDYADNRLTYNVKVTPRSDTIEPEISVYNPSNEQTYSPKEKLELQITATDNLRMKSVVVKCLALDYNKTFVAQIAEPTRIVVEDEISLEKASGEYIFTITATDAQDNITELTRKIIVMFESKPGIFELNNRNICGVAGGTMEFNFDIVTNYQHTIKSVNLEVPALNISKEYAPNSSEFNLKEAIAIDASKAYTRNIPVTVTAVNNIDETTTWTGSCNIIKELYIIGEGTLAKKKEGKALAMKQSSLDMNLYEIITWIDVAGEGFKFLSKPTWNDFNWGLNAKKEVITSASSEFISTASTGYFKVTFNPVTWEYTAVPHTPTIAAKHTEMYVFGHRFLYKEDGKWMEQTTWNKLIKMDVHPDNPHRFYIDVKTGPEKINGVVEKRAIFKFAAQNNLNDGGVYYGTQNKAGDMTVWWEHIGDVWQFDKASAAPNTVENSRSDSEMRIVIDTYLNQMSWLQRGEHKYPL